MRTHMRTIALALFIMIFAVAGAACIHDGVSAGDLATKNVHDSRTPPLLFISDAVRLDGLRYFESEERNAALDQLGKKWSLSIVNIMTSGQIPSKLCGIYTGMAPFDACINPPQNGYGALVGSLSGQPVPFILGDFDRVKVEVKITDGKPDLTEGPYITHISIGGKYYYFGYGLELTDSREWAPPSRNKKYGWNLDSSAFLHRASNAADDFVKKEPEQFYGVVLYSQRDMYSPQTSMFMSRGMIKLADAIFVHEMQGVVNSLVPHR